MRRSNSRNHHRMRTNQINQRGDFSRMVHPNFKHPKTRINRHARKRQGDTEMIVKTAISRMHLAGDAEHMAQHIFCTGFARTSRNGNTFSKIA